MTQIISTFSGVTVDNIAKAREFYLDILGFELLDDTMGLDMRLPGGSRLFVYEKPDHSPAGFTVLNLVVENIDSSIDELAAKGVAFERYDLGNDATQDDKGVLRGLSANMGPDIAWFKDPAGNILAVLQES